MDGKSYVAVLLHSLPAAHMETAVYVVFLIVAWFVAVAEVTLTLVVVVCSAPARLKSSRRTVLVVLCCGVNLSSFYQLVL